MITLGHLLQKILSLIAITLSCAYMACSIRNFLKSLHDIVSRLINQNSNSDDTFFR